MKTKYLYYHLNEPKHTIFFKPPNIFVITRWYENGKKCWESEYQNGKRHGKITCWHDSGEKYWEKELKW